MEPIKTRNNALTDFFKILAAVLSVCVIRYLIGLKNADIGIDDANIYFVYVKNLYDGHGFVYNPGGPRVEGFTSVLWTLFLTLIYSIRFLPFETTALVCCFLLTTSIVFLYFRFCKRHFSAPVAWLVALFILLTPGFIDWNVFALMDLTAWILAVSWAVMLLLEDRHPRIFAILLILLPLIRPEGLALSFILVGLRMFKTWGEGKSLPSAIRSHFLLLTLVTVTVAAITLFRVSYFGYPFPNTFYAKVSVSLMSNIKNGFFYLYDTLRHTSIIPVTLLVVSLLAILYRKLVFQWRAHLTVLILAVICLFFFVYPFLTGGDHFKYSRFFQPLFPLAGLLFVYLYLSGVKQLNSKLVLASLAGLALLNFNSTDDTSFRESAPTALVNYFRKSSLDLFSRSQLQSEYDIATYGRRLASHMNETLSGAPSLPSYAVVAAGGTGYQYNGHIVDLMGLNNPEMAHADRVKASGVKNHGSFDKKIFYEQDADIVLSWPDPLTAEMNQSDSSASVFLQKLRDPAYFINRVCKNIFNDEAFRKQYSFYRIDNGRTHFYGFINPEEFAYKFPGIKISPIGN